MGEDDQEDEEKDDGDKDGAVRAVLPCVARWTIFSFSLPLIPSHGFPAKRRWDDEMRIPQDPYFPSSDSTWDEDAAAACDVFLRAAPCPPPYYPRSHDAVNGEGRPWSFSPSRNLVRFHSHALSSLDTKWQGTREQMKDRHRRLLTGEIWKRGTWESSSCITTIH